MKATHTALVIHVTRLALSSASLAQTGTPGPQIEVQVSGPTRDTAYAQAAQKGLETLLARIVPEGSPTYAAALAAVPRSDVKLGRIVTEQASGGTVFMTVQVNLTPGVLEQAVLRTQPQLAQTRVAVIVPEAILRRPAPDPAAETELNRALITSGLRVVDATQQANNAARELLRAQPTLDASAVADLRTRLNADVLVTGEAFAEEYGAVTGGLRAYTARLEVKVIDLVSGQMLYSQAFQGSAVGVTDAVAGKTALMTVGKVAGAAMPAQLLKVMQGHQVSAARATVVRVAAPVTFTQVNALIEKIKAQPGIQGVTLRAVDAAGGVMEVQFSSTVTQLAALLESLGVRVTGLTGAEITVQF